MVRNFLSRVLGDATAANLMSHLRKEGDPPIRFNRAIRPTPRAPGIETQLKRFEALNISKSGRIEADFAYVGLDSVPANLPFSELFETQFAHRLGQREDGFRRLFERLNKQRSDHPLILETGCLRLPGNWQGDGQSTFMFDAFARSTDGMCVSVDINFQSASSARRACSSYTSVVVNDSVSFINSLAHLSFAKQIDLLYLDSFDVDPVAPLPAAIHHIKELLAAWPMVGPGTIVCVDDFLVGEDGGKAGIIDDFFGNIAAEVLYSGYQKAWIVS
jgi:hypothetical protein